MNAERIALCTTTINIPTVLKLYRAFGPEVEMFVALDRKNTDAIAEFCETIPRCHAIVPAEQYMWHCSEWIGWESIQRRNIAFLAALEWGADIIVTIDDDNIPLDKNYFVDFAKPFTELFNGVSVHSESRWFDPGWLLSPPTTQRGIPGRDITARMNIALDCNVGISAGLVTGRPDTHAIVNMASSPIVSNVNAIGVRGLIVDPINWTVFNSQNTAFLRELAPAMMMLPGIGRYDDIFASLICQRVMRETGHVVRFGLPIVWQQRNAHDLLDDLQAELFGMRHINLFVDWLDMLSLQYEPTVIGMMRKIYTAMRNLEWIPEIVSRCGLAWCDDCQEVL